MVIDFTPKEAGAFTGDVVVTPTLDPLPVPTPHRLPDDIPQLESGSYRIGWFVTGQVGWWRLVDNAADPHKTGIVLKRNRRDWYASSYAKPLSEIMREAVEHFSDTFEKHVIPKLSTKLDGLHPMILK